mmetsp:Transcript_3863/g.6268  ORF Transcript_3863/g.6268 Transcript_3863/m.6268 type:complete len:215 (-) Transcript_3863:488-1132(-)
MRGRDSGRRGRRSSVRGRQRGRRAIVVVVGWQSGCGGHLVLGRRQGRRGSRGIGHVGLGDVVEARFEQFGARRQFERGESFFRLLFKHTRAVTLHNRRRERHASLSPCCCRRIDSRRCGRLFNNNESLRCSQDWLGGGFRVATFHIHVYKTLFTPIFFIAFTCVAVRSRVDLWRITNRPVWLQSLIFRGLFSFGVESNFTLPTSFRRFWNSRSS